MAVPLGAQRKIDGCYELAIFESILSKTDQFQKRQLNV